jgi:hypothetical protein
MVERSFAYVLDRSGMRRAIACTPIASVMVGTAGSPSGEGRLSSGDGVERHGRVGDDPIAVVAGDVAVLFEPIRL